MLRKVQSSFGAIGAVCCSFLLAQVAVAQSADRASERPRSEGGTVSATFENDIFGGTDQNYTNGVRFDYVTPKNGLPLWARFARDQLTPVVPAADWYASYAIGQNMYTPSDITLDAPPADEAQAEEPQADAAAAAEETAATETATETAPTERRRRRR